MAALATGQTAWLATLLVVAGACPGCSPVCLVSAVELSWCPVLYEVLGLHDVPDEIRMELHRGAMMLRGFAGIGFMAYRRKSRPILMAA
jgi:hypothetical protein